MKFLIKYVQSASHPHPLLLLFCIINCRKQFFLNELKINSIYLMALLTLMLLLLLLLMFTALLLSWINFSECSCLFKSVYLVRWCFGIKSKVAVRTFHRTNFNIYKIATIWWHLMSICNWQTPTSFACNAKYYENFLHVFFLDIFMFNTYCTHYIHICISRWTTVCASDASICFLRGAFIHLFFLFLAVTMNEGIASHSIRVF